MKLMQYDRISRKYHLFWSQNQNSIVIQIHKDCARFVKPIPVNSPWVRAMSKTHDADGLFDSFCGDLSGEFFGFNQLIRKTCQSGDLIEFSVPVPEVKKEVGVCGECGGVGKRDELDVFFYCKGSGRRYVYDWRTAYLTTSSLAILFDALYMCDETLANDYQHVIVTMMAEYGMHGSSLCGCFGIDFCEFICKDTMARKIALANAVEAMRGAYGRMMVCQDYDRFRVNANDGYLTLDCPGEACGIHLTDHDRKEERGCEFSCHNVDTPAQSLTLLASISSLVGQAGHFIFASAKNRKLVTT